MAHLVVPLIMKWLPIPPELWCYTGFSVIPQQIFCLNLTNDATIVFLYFSSPYSRFHLRLKHQKERICTRKCNIWFYEINYQEGKKKKQFESMPRASREKQRNCTRNFKNIALKLVASRNSTSHTKSNLIIFRRTRNSRTTGWNSFHDHIFASITWNSFIVD